MSQGPRNLWPGEAVEREYDVVIVGAGFTGSMIAKRLSRAGISVLVLEAGTGEALDFDGYDALLQKLRAQDVKVPNAAYMGNPNAPAPLETDASMIAPGTLDTKGYFVQKGPVPFLSTYTRYAMGTSLHWLGTSLRMLPEDFDVRTRYGIGRDWPISYEDLEPHYRAAEAEIGVSANVADQVYGGLSFPPGYEYPMQRIPPSWGDQWLGQRVDGKTVSVGGESLEVKVTSTPQGRTSIPNGGYKPVGAVDNAQIGHRCMGNSSCTQICPIQAKYNAGKTLMQADPAHAAMVTQAIATRLIVEPGSSRISGVEFKHYESTGDARYTKYTVRGRVVVLAAHAVENAKLLLTSGVANSSGQVGCNLMDHPTHLVWGLAPEGENVMPFRGPPSTSGIESLRFGPHRKTAGAFRVEIGNDGWGWPTNGPLSDLTEFLGDGHWGKDLQQQIQDRCSRQLRFAMLVEQPPDLANRVTIDDRWLDRLGNHRPVIEYDLDDYTRAGVARSQEVGSWLFQTLGATDHTTQDGPFQVNVEYPRDSGQKYAINGAGHYGGTHIMGPDASCSVVNRRQRSWDHENLFLVGPGSMVSLATSNPTLTATALALWAADNISEDLRSL